MRAATHIMNDDLESAEAGLADGASSFHKVCYRRYVLPDLEADCRWIKECTLMTVSWRDIDGKGHGCVPEGYARIRARDHARRYG